MHARHLVLMGLLSFLFGCDSKGDYRKKGGVWRYQKVPVGSGEALPNFTPLGATFARSATSGYYRDSRIAGSDGATFEALSDHYAKDRAHVYYADTYRNSQEYWSIRHNRVDVMEGAEPATFRYLDQRYAKDAKRAYFGPTTFPVQDVATFEVLDYGFAKDRITGYYDQRPVPGSDGASFVNLDVRYAKDRAHVYHVDDAPRANVAPRVERVSRIEGATAESFVVLGEGYARDAARVYHDGRVLLKAPAAFEALLFGYAKSDAQVFFQGRPLPGADAATFRIADTITPAVDAQDRGGTWLGGKRTTVAR